MARGAQRVSTCVRVRSRPSSNTVGWRRRIRRYELDHGGHHYYVRYRHSWLTVDMDDEEVVCLQLAPQDDDDGEWSDEATHVYLHLLSEAIRSASLESVMLPTKSELASHPLFKKGPLPRYHSWLLPVFLVVVATGPVGRVVRPDEGRWRRHGARERGTLAGNRFEREGLRPRCGRGCRKGLDLLFPRLHRVSRLVTRLLLRLGPR